MLIRELKVSNFRALEQVVLPNLQDINILIGRNNSGKSSVFKALQLLSDVIRDKKSIAPTDITNQDEDRTLHISMVVELSEKERGKHLEILGETLLPKHKERLFNSSYARLASFSFVSPPNFTVEQKRRFALFSIGLSSQDDLLLHPIYEMNEDQFEQNPRKYQFHFKDLIRLVQLGHTTLSGPVIDLESALGRISSGGTFEASASLTFSPDILTGVLLQQFRAFLHNLYFFDPFRHSHPQQTVHEAESLDSTGSNLAQRLHTIHSNDRPLFKKIQDFMHGAIPDVGLMHTPLSSTNTAIGFTANNGGFQTKLHDMGGGVEQLLMIATVLHGEKSNFKLFLEEPESHLHAGAQRFLIEQLVTSGRQIFVTTHSPTFVNTEKSHNLYRVKLTDGKTEISEVREAEHLSELLQDIGSRNSDVLLSDGILFVEGPGDKTVFETLAEKLDLPFGRRNISVIPLGGGERIDGLRSKAREDLLAQISQKTPVPSLFVVDRDERGENEIRRVAQSTTNVHILAKRELENYFLIPHLIRRTLIAKYATEDKILENLNNQGDEALQQIIVAKANSLYVHVLMRRIRSELGGVEGGMFNRDDIDELVSRYDKTTHRGTFATDLAGHLRSRLGARIKGKNIESVITKQNEKLTEEWKDHTARLFLAPGEELIQAVFSAVGGRYKKDADTILFASLIQRTEIDPELRRIIETIHSLTSKQEVNR